MRAQQIMTSQVPQLFAIVLVLFGAIALAWGQDVAKGRRLAERWCAACHATGAGPTKFNRAQPLAAIAARQDISSDLITSFLLLPHATMPNLPLTDRTPRISRRSSWR